MDGYSGCACDSAVALSSYDIFDETVAFGGAACDRCVGEADSTLGAIVLWSAAAECDHMVTGDCTLVSGLSAELTGTAIKGALP